MKICQVCKTEQSLDQFWPCRGTRDGLHYRCITCFKVSQGRQIDKIKAQLEDQKSNPEKWDELIRNTLYNNARKRAKLLGVEFTIQPNDIHVVHECPILHAPLEKAIGVHERHSYSLDRRDSSRGYVPGNVFVISQRANNLKSNFTIEEVERLLRYMKGET